MNYLLDTHTCIWSIAEQEKLSARVREILLNQDNRFFVSKISLLEIVIKLKVGKLVEFNTPFTEFVSAVYLSGYEMLPLKDGHLDSYNMLNFADQHRDPFDRYILAVAHAENLAILTKDEKFQLYADKFNIIW